jgi:hypothetical protein
LCCPVILILEFSAEIVYVSGLMQAEPATAFGLIQAGPLSNGATVEPGAARIHIRLLLFGKV